MSMGTQRLILGAAIAISATVVVAIIRSRPPSLPSPLRLVVRFDSGIAGRADPLIVSGKPGAGDFLYVKFLDSSTALFGYDDWGLGGPTSKPVKLSPGLVHHLEIEGPMLTDVVGHTTGKPHVRIICDGVIVFDNNVSYHRRDPERIYVAWNPIGGTSCGRKFHGYVKREDGHALSNRWSLNSWKIRLADSWTPELRRLLQFLLLAGAIIFGCEKLFRSGRSGSDAEAVGAAPGFRHHACFAATAAVATLVFSYMVTDGDFRFVYPESFGIFYDYQAVSLLHGRLDVPRLSIGDEAFVVHGKTYGYFGPTPAVMRIPFAMFHAAFGKLSRVFMLLDYLGCLVFAYLILRLAVRMLRGADASPSRWSIVVLVANAGLGSTLLFLGSRAYIYHEAILCGAAFALASCYFSLRHLVRPEGKSWIVAWACGLLSVNARPTAGLFAFGFLGCAALAALIRSRFQSGAGFSARPTIRTLAIGAACVVGMASCAGMSYLKFRSFDVMPLRYHVKYDPARLAHIGGKNFYLGNLACDIEGYLWGPSFNLRPTFPYFYSDGPDPRDYPEAKIDMVEGIVALPYAMSGLFSLAVGGSILAATRAKPLRWAVAAAWAAVVPLCMALFTAVVISQRYTGDFCPFLIVAAALGLAACEGVKLGAAARTVIWMLTLWSILATLALALDYQGDGVWGVPDEVHARFQHLRSGMDRLLNLHPDGPSP